MYKFIPLLTALITLLSANCDAAEKSASSSSKPEIMAVRYSEPMDGNDDARFGYIFALIHRSLEITRPEFGNYVIEPYRTELSTQRHAVVLTEGTALNLAWASPGTVVAKSDAIPIKIDILQGLLGYRVCLYNSTSSLKLDQIKSLDDLNNVKMGQGINWADNLIYDHNKIPLVEAPTFESLFRMLALNRFDCLPLGVNEVKHVFLDKKDAYPFLALDDKLLIYYRFPIYFHVSKKTPELAKRIEMGLKKMQKSGEFDRLFTAHHAKNLASLNLKNRKIICLESPYVADKNQCAKAITIPNL